MPMSTPTDLLVGTAAAKAAAQSADATYVCGGTCALGLSRVDFGWSHSRCILVGVALVVGCDLARSRRPAEHVLARTCTNLNPCWPFSRLACRSDPRCRRKNYPDPPVCLVVLSSSSNALYVIMSGSTIVIVATPGTGGNCATRRSPPPPQPPRWRRRRRPLRPRRGRPW